MKIQICESCNYQTEDKSDFNKHLKTVKHLKNVKGESKERKYECKCCNYEEIDKSNFNKHLKSKKHLMNEKGETKVEKIYDCEECKKANKSYVTKIKCNYELHCNRMHNDRTKMRFLCLACKEYIENNRDRLNHVIKKEHKKNVFDNFSECCKDKYSSIINPAKSILFMKKCNIFVKSDDKCNVSNNVIKKYDDENKRIKEAFNNEEEFNKLKADHKKDNISIAKRSRKSNNKNDDIELYLSGSDSDSESEEENDEEDELPKKVIKINNNLDGKIIKSQIKNLTGDDIGMQNFKKVNDLTIDEMKKLIDFTFNTLQNNDFEPDDFEIFTVNQYLEDNKDNYDEEDNETLITKLYGKCYDLMTDKDRLESNQMKFDRISKNKRKQMIEDAK